MNMVADIEEIRFVNFATRTIGIILLMVAASGTAAAQNLPLPDPDFLELPSESMYPSEYTGEMSEELPPANGAESYEPSRLVRPPKVVSQPGGEYGEYQGQLGCDDDWGANPYQLWDAEPAVVESSGTWLDRGVWYAEADGVVLNRIFDRDEQMFVADDPNVVNQGFFAPFGLGLPSTNRTIVLQGKHPGEDASVRVTLGRFLFRDDNNRDHTAEFTAFGGGDWVQDHNLSSDLPFGLFTTFPIAGGNVAFDGTSRQRLIYSSRYNSFELNYRVKRRLGRDQMVMDPNGRWRREASNGFTRSYLAGLRYLELREILDWRAEDILVVGDDGKYLINTDNDMFGVQFGQGLDYETGRWSVGIRAKGGFYVNDADVISQLDFTADDVDDFRRRNTEDELSFIGETALQARWHVTPNFSLRAGWEFLFIESIAIAPKQANFINNYSKVNTAGYAFYMGGSLGFEGYW